MKTKKLKFALLALVFLLPGCGINVRTQTVGNGPRDLGGVFVSSNKGEAFQQMSNMPTVSNIASSINSVDINEMIVDPSDSAAIYLVTEADGVYYTYNINDGWNRVEGLPREKVGALAVDPKDKCTIYVAMKNKIYKSDDCTRTWREVYVDNNPAVEVAALAVDYYSNKSVYLGTTRGDVIKSLDYGRSWKTIQKLDDGVKKIIINPKDSRQVLIVSNKSGIYRFNSNEAVSLDSLADYRNKFDGNNWTDLNSELRKYKLGINFKGLVFGPADNSLFFATASNFLRSTDNGVTWTDIKLITPAKETNIEAIAVNPKDSKEIYYVTPTTFYHSIDGGSNWITKQLPTKRSGSSLLVDKDNPNIIYLGIKTIK
jgi:hypothetical protein